MDRRHDVAAAFCQTNPRDFMIEAFLWPVMLRSANVPNGTIGTDAGYLASSRSRRGAQHLTAALRKLSLSFVGTHKVAFVTCIAARSSPCLARIWLRRLPDGPTKGVPSRTS